jgi:hypothetical protein
LNNTYSRPFNVKEMEEGKRKMTIERTKSKIDWKGITEGII